MWLLLTVVPGEGPCLRCVFPTPPPAGTLPTCETRGILGTLPATIAAAAATEAIKLLCGGERSPHLLSLDLWNRSVQLVQIKRDDACPACGDRRFEFLEQQSVAAVRCGRDAIQISPAEETRRDLDVLSHTLAALGTVSYNGMTLQFAPDDVVQDLVFFLDGRVLVRGTSSEATARSILARYVGG